MTSVSKTIMIDYPLQASWDIFSDLSRLGEWDPTIQSVTTLGSPGVGQRIDIEQNSGDGQLRYMAAFMTRYKAPHEFAFRYNQLGTTWQFRYRLEDNGPRTKVIRTRTAIGIWGLLVMLRKRDAVEVDERQIALRTKQILDEAARAKK